MPNLPRIAPLAARLWLVFALLLSLAPAASAAPRPSAANSCQKRVRFLGFSTNERVWVSQTTLVCRDETEGHDEMVQAQVHITASGDILATYRCRPDRHTTARGTVIARSPQQWAALYPASARTLNVAAWERFQANAKLRRLQHDFENEVARLRADDGDLAHVHVANQRLQVTGAATHPWHAEMLVTTMAGNDIAVADVAGRASERIGLQLFYSGTGRHVAVVVERPGQVAEILVTPKALPDPIDMPKLGAVNFMNWEQENFVDHLSAMRPTHHARDPELEAMVDEALAF